MPFWATILLKLALPLILQWAVKNGKLNEVEAQLIKFGMSLRSYHDPEDFPNPPPELNTNRNFNLGGK